MPMLDALDGPQPPTDRERIAALEAQVATLLQFARAVMTKTETTDHVVKAMTSTYVVKKEIAMASFELGETLRGQFPRL